MSTVSLPFGSDEVPEVDLKLPECMRSELRRPFGKLMTGTELLQVIMECDRLIAVGDIVTYDLLDNGVRPWIAIYDGKSERAERTDLLERIDALEAHQAKVRNPPATITAETIKAVKIALTRTGSTKILVEGEEDLAALVCVALAPLGSCVVYGAPGEGVVLVEVDQKNVTIARSLISKMEESH